MDMVLQLVGVTAITCIALPLMTIPMVRHTPQPHKLEAGVSLYRDDNTRSRSMFTIIEASTSIGVSRAL